MGKRVYFVRLNVSCIVYRCQSCQGQIVLLKMKHVAIFFVCFLTCCTTDLPELHADGTVQLHQTRLKMHGLAFRVVQVDGSALVVVTLDLTQMHAQVVA